MMFRDYHEGLFSQSSAKGVWHNWKRTKIYTGPYWLGMENINQRTTQEVCVRLFFTEKEQGLVHADARDSF